mgnify:CR=1 FL=1
MDLLLNNKVKNTFIKRTKIIRFIRTFLDEHKFLEVETPVLQPIYGGANAKPFTTHHNALDQDFYLRIATELYLKQLIVGGFEKVYELSKDFIEKWRELVLKETKIELTDWYDKIGLGNKQAAICLLYTSPSPRDRQKCRMPSSA